MLGPMAPRDPEEKRKGFYILLDQKVGGLPQEDGRGCHPIFLGDGRLVTFAKMVGGIHDAYMLSLLETADGFRTMVHSLGVAITTENPEMEVGFTLGFRRSDFLAGNEHSFSIRGDGVEQQIVLDRLTWKRGDAAPAVLRFTFPSMYDTATVTVKLYLNDGFDAPDNDPDPPVEVGSRAYERMIARSCLSVGNNFRLKELLRRARAGEEVTLAFLGGSITQGAGAIPIQQECYSRKTFEAFRARYGANARYIKAGVGGTPSETGMMRYARDITRDGTVRPDLVVLEFAVNDSSDETEGVCYESLVKTILDEPWKPAVVLLFAVFANDWNLKDRLAPIGWRWQLPMVNVLEAVSPEFGKPAGERVLTKRQYFYDQYHPSNLGHTIMADSLLYLLDRADAEQISPEIPYDFPPHYGTDFAHIRFFDRKDALPGAVITPGSFTETDDDLQCVPFDDAQENTPEFPYNWSKGSGDAPFRLELTCSKLVLECKDTAREDFGCAEVRVDGELVRTINPREAGWTHCHTVILFNKRETRPHTVELRMTEADREKRFTILGFGAV